MTGLNGPLAHTAIAAATLWLGSAIPAHALDDPRADGGVGLLEAESVLFLEVARPEELLDRAMSGRVKAFLGAIPGYEAALDSPQLREGRQVAEFVAAQLDTTWEEGLRTLIGGGVVVGIEEADPPRLVLVVTPTDAEFLQRAHDTLVSLARDDARNKNNPDPIAEFEHREIPCFSVSDEEAHAIVDGRLVLSNSRDGLESIIDRHLDGEGDRLADSSFYLDRKPDSDPMAWAFARVDRLRELDPDRFAPGDDEPDAGAMLLVGAWLDLLQETPTASASLDWTDDRLAATLTLDAPTDGRSGPMSRFLPPEGEGAPRPLKVPDQIASINLWRDQESLWQVREELLPPEALQGLAQLDSFAGTFFGGREFGDSVLAPLGNHWQAVAALQDYEAMDPQPEVKLPGFALVVDLDPDRPEFPQRLRVAFQSFLGLVNLGAAETGAPPLMLGSDSHDGVAIAHATFMAPADPAVEGDEDDGEEPAEVHYRHNFSPAVAEVEGRFIVSSSIELTRALIDAIKADPEVDPTEDTLLMTADGPALAGLVETNRERLMLQNMLEKGNDREAADREIAVLAALLKYLGQGTLHLKDEAERSTLTLEFLLGELD